MKTVNLFCGNYSRITKRILLSLATCTLVSALQAQDNNDEDDIFELSPFEVQSARDYGYRLTNAMTATRVGTPIMETPLFISVVSEELMQDLALASSIELFNYSASINTSYDNQTNLLATGVDGGVKIRGFGTSFVYQDNVRRFNAFHIDGIDRTEVVKGPAGLYFGRTDPGGIINFVTKKPQFIFQTNVTAMYGSDDFYKGIIDTQGVIANDKVAYRATISKRDSEDWFESVEWDEEYFLGSVSFRPTRKIDILVQYEHFDQIKSGGTVPAISINQLYFRALEAQGLIELAPGEVVGDLIYEPDVNWADYPVLMRSNGLYETMDVWSRRVSNELGFNLRNASGFWFPRGRTFNRNGPGAFDNNKSRSLTATAKIELLPNLNLRAVFSTVETDTAFSWFINQDPGQAPNRMAAFATNGNPNTFTSLNYGFQVTPSFRPDGRTVSGRQADVNNYDTYQLDLTYDLEIGKTRHTFVGSIEYIENDFKQYGFLTDRDAFIAAGGIPGGVRGFGDDPGISAESNQILMQRRQQLVSWGIIGADDPIPGRGGPWSSFYVDLKNPDSVVPNQADFLIGRASEPNSGSESEDTSFAFNYLGKYLEDRLHVLAGVRYQEYQVRDNLADPREEWLKFDQTVFTLGANYFLTPEVVVYASYSENFVPTSAQSDSYLNRDTGEIVGGERLEPQVGEGMEIGVKTSLFDGMITGSFAVFNVTRAQIPINDLERAMRLVNENLNAADPDNPPWVNADSLAPVDETRIPSFTKAGGEQQVEGFETEIIFTPNENFQAIFSFNYYWKAEWTVKDPALINVQRGGQFVGLRGINDGQDAIPDRLENVPDMGIGFWGVYRFTEGSLEGLRLGFGGNYEAEQIHEARTNGSWIPVTTGDWIRFDAMVGYDFGGGEDPWRIQLNVANVFDEKYMTGSFGVAPTRTWKLTLRKSF